MRRPVPRGNASSAHPLRCYRCRCRRCPPQGAPHTTYLTRESGSGAARSGHLRPPCPGERASGAAVSATGSPDPEMSGAAGGQGKTGRAAGPRGARGQLPAPPPAPRNERQPPPPNIPHNTRNPQAGACTPSPARSCSLGRDGAIARRSG